MKNDAQIEKTIKVLSKNCKDWTNEVNLLGNQCAYSDRILEHIIDTAKVLITLYETNEGE